jgi:hypothetical protein
VSAFLTVVRSRRGRVVTVLAVSAFASLTVTAGDTDAPIIDRNPASDSTDTYGSTGGPSDDGFEIDLGGGFDLAAVGGRKGGDDVPDVPLPVVT